MTLKTPRSFNLLYFILNSFHLTPNQHLHTRTWNRQLLQLHPQAHYIDSTLCIIDISSICNNNYYYCENDNNRNSENNDENNNNKETNNNNNININNKIISCNTGGGQFLIMHTAVVRYDNNVATIPFVGPQHEAQKIAKIMTAHTHKHHVFLFQTKKKYVPHGPYHSIEQVRAALNGNGRQ